MSHVGCGGTNAHHAVPVAPTSLRTLPESPLFGPRCPKLLAESGRYRVLAALSCRRAHDFSLQNSHIVGSPAGLHTREVAGSKPAAPMTGRSQVSRRTLPDLGRSVRRFGRRCSGRSDPVGGSLTSLFPAGAMASIMAFARNKKVVARVRRRPRRGFHPVPRDRRRSDAVDTARGRATRGSIQVLWHRRFVRSHWTAPRCRPAGWTPEPRAGAHATRSSRSARPSHRRSPRYPPASRSRTPCATPLPARPRRRASASSAACQQETGRGRGVNPRPRRAARVVRPSRPSRNDGHHRAKRSTYAKELGRLAASR
jgi:hypothetical protein